MKTIYPLLLLAGLLWSSLALASDALLIGPATIKLSCRAQALYYQPISSKTNLVGSNTNVTSVYKSTVTNFTMDATSLLDLFANSLNTNFPSGTRLLLYGRSGYFTLAISDNTGTNISLPVVVGLLNAYNEGQVIVGRSTQSTTNQVLVAGNDTEAFTSAVQLLYDDYPQTNTTDGTRTIFHLNCRIESKQSRNLATGFATENVTMTVTGGGGIRNGPPVIITGTIRGTTSGMP